MIILCSSSAGRQIEKWWRCQPTSYIVYACTENWKWSWAKVKGVKGVTVKKRGICVAVENQQQQHYNTSHQKCATIIKSNRPVARAQFTLLFNVVMCLPTSTETTFAHTPDRKCVCVCVHTFGGVGCWPWLAHSHSHTEKTLKWHFLGERHLNFKIDLSGSLVQFGSALQQQQQQKLLWWDNLQNGRKIAEFACDEKRL